MPGHYEHGFDPVIRAPDSSYSLFLKGGNDSNFGMTLKLPAPAGADSDADPAALPDEAETEDPLAFDGNFCPASVTFYVRTDNERADAGHFILGESNEVNKRVAQFQFTKDGRMGLLGVRAPACTPLADWTPTPRGLTRTACARAYVCVCVCAAGVRGRREVRRMERRRTRPTVGT